MKSLELKKKLEMTQKKVEKRQAIINKMEPGEDLEDNLLKLEQLKNARNNWQIKYDIQLNKEQAPKIKVLWDFLNDWEAKTISWYKENVKTYLEALNEYKSLQRKFYEENDYLNAEPMKQNRCKGDFLNHLSRKFGKCIYDSKNYAKQIKRVDSLIIELTDTIFVRDENYSYYKLNNVAYAYGEYEIISFNDEKLKAIVEEEKLNKYFDLCDRISNVVGEIKDVSNLSIGRQNGEINGYVLGAKGSCFVETISAGGYNIQRFHFRVLVKKQK